MKRRALFAAVLAAPTAFFAAMKPKVWTVSVVPFHKEDATRVDIARHKDLVSRVRNLKMRG